MNAPVFIPPRSASVDATSSSFLQDVLDGLGARPKTLPAKYFYDLEGSQLFGEITHLPEYYPTRTELGILRDRADEIGRLCPERSAVVEFGAGPSEKIRLLLSTMPSIAAYVPIDVSADFLRAEAEQVRAAFPDIEVFPVAADFTHEMSLPRAISRLRRIGFFPGSTIGNFEPPDAKALLRHFADVLGEDALLIVGIDLVKPHEVLNAAYDDESGTTARFNLNLLTRINRELDGNFDISRFEHRAFFNSDLSRVEMHLVSQCRQQVQVAGQRFDFDAAETIHTENSYKYTPGIFQAVAQEAGWSMDRMFTDDDQLFAVFALRN